VAVQLPPMARALQEFVDALPHGPLPQGMPGPSPDDMINLLNHMMIPPQFYTPPATMRVGTGANKSSSGPSSGNGRHGGRQGGKRGKRDDDDSPVTSPPHSIFPCRVCCPCSVGSCVMGGGRAGGFAAWTGRHVPAAAETAFCQHYRLASSSCSCKDSRTQHTRLFTLGTSPCVSTIGWYYSSLRTLCMVANLEWGRTPAQCQQRTLTPTPLLSSHHHVVSPPCAPPAQFIPRIATPLSDLPTVFPWAL
jgi:hypothetical protein